MSEGIPSFEEIQDATLEQQKAKANLERAIEVQQIFSKGARVAVELAESIAKTYGVPPTAIELARKVLEKLFEEEKK